MKPSESQTAPQESSIRNISDTARWVAVYRATEAERPDALFRDPLAARLAGHRGREIAASMPRSWRRNMWPLIMRTKAVDDLVLDAIGEGADRVVNLAAGLDARPYRLPLSAALTWVEADLPGMIEEKERALRHEVPRCLLTREGVDLADPASRAAFLDRAVEGARNVVVITEGLLVYLDEAGVQDLAVDLLARAPIRTWVLDLTSPAVLKMLRRRLATLLSADAEMRFAPDNGVAFFAPLGWKATIVRSMFRDAYRTGRLPLMLRPFGLIPDPDPAHPGRRPWSAVIRFERSTHAHASNVHGSHPHEPYGSHPH
jgi:methyltransferase (TIGR00027 family)